MNRGSGDFHIVQIHLHISIATIIIPIHPELHVELARFTSFSKSVLEFELLTNVHSFSIPRAEIGVLSLVAIIGTELGILRRLVRGVVTNSDTKQVKEEEEDDEEEEKSDCSTHR